MALMRLGVAATMFAGAAAGVDTERAPPAARGDEAAGLELGEAGFDRAAADESR